MFPELRFLWPSLGCGLGVVWFDRLGIAVLYLSLGLFLSLFPSMASELPWEPARPFLGMFFGSVILTDGGGGWEVGEEKREWVLSRGGVLEQL